MTSAALVLLMTLPGIALFYAGMVPQRECHQHHGLCGGNRRHGQFSCGFTARRAYSGLHARQAAGCAAATGCGSAALNAKERRQGGCQPCAPATFRSGLCHVPARRSPHHHRCPLAVGALVERMKFSAMLWVLSGCGRWSCSAPSAHWLRGTGGWLAQHGALDFAGASVVHQRRRLGQACAYSSLAQGLGARRSDRSIWG